MPRKQTRASIYPKQARLIKNMLSILGLSQTELASKIGRSAPTVHQWATGQKRTPETELALACFVTLFHKHFPEIMAKHVGIAKRKKRNNLSKESIDLENMISMSNSLIELMSNPIIFDVFPIMHLYPVNIDPSKAIHIDKTYVTSTANVPENIVSELSNNIGKFLACISETARIFNDVIAEQYMADKS